MSEIQNIIIGKNSIPSLTITVILMIAIPIIFFLYWRIKHRQQTRIVYLIAGILGFIVSARVLELGVHYFCIITDNPVSRFINGNSAAYILYGICMAGIFEECGRYLILKYVMRKNRTPENAVLYGIGHGGIEVLTVILPAMIAYLMVAVFFSAGNMDEAFRALNITEETAAAALPSIQAAATFGYAAMALNVIERLIAMVLHIGLTVMVFYGVCSAKKSWLAAAILLHMLMDLFPAMYQRNLLPLGLVEVWGAAWAVVTAIIAMKLYREMKS